MINIGKILKRSWQILWTYRVLWVFGILLALTAGGGGSGSSGSGFQFNGNNNYNWSSGYNPNFQPGSFWQQLTDWFNQNITPLFEYPSQHIATFIWIGVAFLLFILLVAAVTTIIRYVSENAVIRMVDEYEQAGTKVGFRQGWKLGWNRRAFRLWVIDLVINIPTLLFVGLLFGLGLLVFFSVTSGNPVVATSGTIAAVGCAFLFIFAFIVLMVFLNLLRQFFVRAAVMEETRISESFRRGWAMFKRNWKSVALMWLVMLGIGIGFGIASLILFILLIPAYLILILPALFVAAIPAAIAFGIASIFTIGPVAWIVAILVALPFFFLVIFSPLVFIGGWYKIYSSNVWTLTYREINALEAVKTDEIPAEIA